MSRGTILFLEDDKDLQSLVSAYLRERGYEVEPARTVKEARTVIACLRVDAAIVDGLLPGMTGTDFIQELRQQHPTLPILFASAFWKDLKSHDHLTRQRKVSRVLHKPYTPQELLLWVEQMLAVKPPSPPPAAMTEGQDSANDLDATFKALRAEYGARLEDKMRELTGALERARAGSAEGMDAAYELAHKLHGTAGSYGFHAVSGAARHLEALLKPVRDGKGAPDWRALEAARQELAKETRSGAPAVAPSKDADTEATKGSAVEVEPRGTVLVVDEDEAWLAEVERMGKDRLVRVVTARGADEAVKVARRQRLDGALVHVDLGGKEGGFAVAERLRAEEELRTLPLAFFGTGGDVTYRMAAILAGASLYLPRPFSALDLAEAVERMVAVRRPERARVLVLDDDPDAVRALSVALTSQQVEVVGLGDPYRLVDALAEQRPDLLLLDVEMPGPSGFDLCRIVRSMPEWQALPILFITAHTGVDFRVAAFQAGADDYLAKPVLREELRARVQSRLERARLARERAERDALTGLLLRRPFLEGLRARLAEAQRTGRTLALGFLDVDRFKKVNDTHGHLAGDRVLMQMGRLLASRFRREDLQCRWGGEEFVVALVGASAEGARDILARMAAELAQADFEGDKGEHFRVSFSAGVAVAPQDGADVESLLRAADERLYRAKAQGGNRIER
ncbi:response regulator [Archangium lansingense]|uniref:Response regulator n=1 Tax=Archangium lansingense TaxID=2995310 RepID=A0ABT4A1T6_9BACT|nr:response regulator [Archangium lansinium]MCY1075595.1 response regulator [Archangium lansinium]